ncbi:SDR family oxidoreductase [Chondromyces apiculatus]|nr:SDR family oxidoreductase [Chondromyces apiculatus]
MKEPAAKSDPKDREPKPPFPPQEQDRPGFESRMDPRPDHGEDTYKGTGRLKDRVALITGGDSGIGRAVALAFAREGADVAIAYLREEQEDAEGAKRSVEEAGRKAVLIPVDLVEESECKRLVDATVKHFGRIDILVNNAAEQGKSVEKFEDIGAARVERTFRVNIIAMFHLVRHALPHMTKGSSIINVSSVQAYLPSAEILDYATTKGAIVAFSKGLAESLIERGIRVNSVAPGPVWTPLVIQSFDAKKNSEFGKNSPMKRPAQPGELAPAFVFLASDESSYINGEVLGVTGGKPLG